jgi:transcriptional regulator with GAF, ATPase, and Fis domain
VLVLVESVEEEEVLSSEDELVGVLVLELLDCDVAEESEVDSVELLECEVALVLELVDVSEEMGTVSPMVAW